MGFAADVGAGSGFSLLGRQLSGNLIRFTNPFQFCIMNYIPIFFKNESESNVSSKVPAHYFARTSVSEMLYVFYTDLNSCPRTV